MAQEQTGRATNALGWCTNNPQKWMLEACSPYQIETWIKPLMTDARHECYAITEAEAGSDVDAIQATARRDGDHYVLNGEKWHVTSANLADYMFFQAKIADGPNARRPRPVLRRSWYAGHRDRAHTGLYPTPTAPTTRSISFTDVRVPVDQPHRRGRRRHGLHLCLVPP